MAKKKTTSKKKAGTSTAVEKQATVEVPLPEDLKWKMLAHNQVVEKHVSRVKAAQAAVSAAQARVEVERAHEQRARDQLQNALDALKDVVDIPEGYEMSRLALDRGVILCGLFSGEDG